MDCARTGKGKAGPPPRRLAHAGKGAADCAPRGLRRRPPGRPTLAGGGHQRDPDRRERLFSRRGHGHATDDQHQPVHDAGAGHSLFRGGQGGRVPPGRPPARVRPRPARLPGGGHHPAGQRPRPVQPGEALHHLPEPEGREARDRQHSPAGAEKHAHVRNPMSRERTMRKAALALAALWLVTAGPPSAPGPPPSRGPPGAETPPPPSSQAPSVDNQATAGMPATGGKPAEPMVKPAAPPPPLPPQVYLSMDFTDVDLPVLIKFISEQTRKNFIFDERVQGKITIISPRRISLDEANNVFLSVLHVKGFATVEQDDTIKIIPIGTARQEDMPTETEGG